MDVICRGFLHIHWIFVHIVPSLVSSSLACTLHDLSSVPLISKRVLLLYQTFLENYSKNFACCGGSNRVRTVAV